MKQALTTHEADLDFRNILGLQQKLYLSFKGKKHKGGYG